MLEKPRETERYPVGNVLLQGFDDQSRRRVITRLGGSSTFSTRETVDLTWIYLFITRHDFPINIDSTRLIKSLRIILESTKTETERERERGGDESLTVKS